MRQFAAELTDLKIGFCIDTCHCMASGYDVSTAAGLKRTVAEMDRTLGIENVPVIHTNDSKTPFNSHVDRHEHIGKGISAKRDSAGFSAIRSCAVRRSFSRRPTTRKATIAGTWKR